MWSLQSVIFYPIFTYIWESEKQLPNNTKVNSKLVTIDNLESIKNINEPNLDLPEVK